MVTDETISKAGQEFDKALQHMRDEFSRLQMGRANPGLIESLNVDMYGTQQPMKAVASISVPDARSLMIAPWDKAAIAPIEKAIVNSTLGLNPVVDGHVVRINIPALTEERRADLTKHVKKLAEDAKISVRNSRQDAHNVFKKLKGDNDITEDDLRDSDKALQDKVDAANSQVDKLASEKEKDVMTV